MKVEKAGTLVHGSTVSWQGVKGNFSMLQAGFSFYVFEKCQFFIVLHRTSEQQSSWDECDSRGINIKKHFKLEIVFINLGMNELCQIYISVCFLTMDT